MRRDEKYTYTHRNDLRHAFVINFHLLLIPFSTNNLFLNITIAISIKSENSEN